jgi:mercuric reductase
MSAAEEPGFRLSIKEGLEAGRALFGPSLAGIDKVSRPAIDPKSVRNRAFRVTDPNGGADDLAIIGAGSAGFSATITAGEQGAWVALIGSGTIGGTCVNIGCVPSKTLIHAAETLHNARVAARFAGITAEAQLHNWQETVHQKDTLISKLHQTKYVDLLSAYDGIAYRDGPACLVEAGRRGEWRTNPGRQDHHLDRRSAGRARHSWHRLRVLSHQHECARPREAAALVACHRRRLYRRGACQMFARAGVRVTLVCRSRLLPEPEPEIGAALSRCFQNEEISFVSGIAYRHIRRVGNAVSLTVAQNGQDMALDGHCHANWRFGSSSGQDGE